MRNTISRILNGLLHFKQRNPVTVKGDHELAYWETRKAEEGTLSNSHYEYFYTTHFGLGDAKFAHYHNILDRYYFCLMQICQRLKTQKKFKNVTLYKVPEKIPFKNRIVGYKHCCHMIEHLYSQELYSFLKKNGILIVSIPRLVCMKVSQRAFHMIMRNKAKRSGIFSAKFMKTL